MEHTRVIDLTPKGKTKVEEFYIFPKGETVDENQNIKDIIGKEIKLSYQKGDLHKFGVATKLCSIEYIEVGE